MNRLSLYLKLIRWDKPVGTLLLLWPTLWALWLASDGFPSLKLLVIFSLGTFFMRSAGCAINDVADRHFDAHVQRTANRVVATGLVSVKEALIVCAVCALFAGFLALNLNAFTLWLCLPAALVAIAYPFCKRFFAVPQAVLGIAFSFGIPMAYAAVLNEIPVQAWWLFAANFAWVMAYDTAYAMVDKPDDLKLGLKTSAIFFGRYDAFMVIVFKSAFFIILGYLFFNQSVHWVVWLFYWVAAMYAVYLSLKVFSGERAACFYVFVNNHKIGFLIWCGLCLSSLIP